MQYNSYLNGVAIGQSCDDYISYLTNENEAYSTLSSRISKFLREESSSSIAINGLKTQMGDYTLVLGSLNMANNNDIDDANTLKGLVGSEVIDGMEVIKGKNEASSDAKSARSSAYSARQKAYFATSTEEAAKYNQEANMYDGIASSADQRYSYFQRKEDKYDEINSASSSLFEKSYEGRNKAYQLLQMMYDGFVDGQYVDTPERTQLRSELTKYYLDERKSLYNIRYSYPYGEVTVDIDWDEVKAILSKDKEDITPEEWEMLADLAYNMPPEEFDKLMTYFVDVRYNANGEIEVGVDIDKYEEFVYYLGVEYRLEYPDGGFSLNEEGKEKQQEMYQRYILFSNLPVEDMQNNYYSVKNPYEIGDWDGTEEEYLEYVKNNPSIADFYPYIHIERDSKGNYIVVTNPFHPEIDGYNWVDDRVYHFNVSTYSEDARGSRIGLNEDFVKVIDKDGNVYYGGDQGWFAGDPVYGDIDDRGCGVIAAVNTYLYLAGITEITKEEYMELVKEFADKYLPSDPLWAVGIGVSPIAITDYLQDKLKEKGIQYDISWGTSGDQWEAMKQMVSAGIPVIWGQFDTTDSINDKLDDWFGWTLPGGDTLTYYYFDGVDYKESRNYQVNGHYVTVTGLIEQEQPDGTEKRYIEISSWGGSDQSIDQKYYVDYDEYLEYVDPDNGVDWAINGVGSNVLVII